MSALGCRRQRMSIKQSILCDKCSLINLHSMEYQIRDERDTPCPRRVDAVEKTILRGSGEQDCFKKRTRRATFNSRNTICAEQ